MQKPNKPIKIALLDLYNGQPAKAISSLVAIIEQYQAQYRLNLQTDVFSVRDKNEMPAPDYDIYIGSGGPGSPLDSEGSAWEQKFFNLFKQLDIHNTTAGSEKKHSLLICHSFQLMCRQWSLGTVNRRRNLSYGIFPVKLTQAGTGDPLFNHLPAPLYVLDSRYWQVICPDHNRLAQTGAEILAMEDAALAGGHPQALMAVRFNPYMVGVQFHPEAIPAVLQVQLAEGGGQQFIAQYGQASYQHFIDELKDNRKLQRTCQTIIPNFLDEAVKASIRV